MSTLTVIIIAIVSVLFPNPAVSNITAAAKVIAPQAQEIKQETKSTKEIVIEPNRLVIPSIGVNARVLGMGITDGGRMAVPNNFVDVGWFQFGAAPGQPGTTVMGAHVDNGGRISGVFKNLKNLKVGKTIYVSDDSGTVLQYKVTSRKIYGKNMSDTSAVFASSGKSRLNLITCYGAWLPKEKTYASRLVVSAELVSVNPAEKQSRV